MDYDFAHLDLRDDTEGAVARRRGWVRAMRRNFRNARPDEEFEKHWLEHALADDQIVTGAWLPEGEFGAGPTPVATFTSFDKTINMGSALLPARLITDVTTSPAHRRRGLQQRLMTDSLTHAVADQIPVAALTASEATIYGRWGFGVATLLHGIQLDTGPRFGLHEFVDPGRVEMIEPPDAWPLIEGVFKEFHLQTRGSLDWPAFYQQILTGTYDFDGGEDRKLLGAVHLDSAGRIDGFALFRHDADGDARIIRVVEMASLNTTAQLALWDFLGHVDRVTRVDFPGIHPEDPLPWALTDFNCLKTTGVQEFLWLRVLDVPRVLQARPWSADGRIVVGIDDTQGHVAGHYEVVTHQGEADVRITDAAIDLSLSAEVLASLVLGTVGARKLHQAGRILGSAEAAARLAAMSDLAVAPYCITGF